MWQLNYTLNIFFKKLFLFSFYLVNTTLWRMVQCQSWPMIFKNSFKKFYGCEFLSWFKNLRNIGLYFSPLGLVLHPKEPWNFWPQTGNIFDPKICEFARIGHFHKFWAKIMDGIFLTPKFSALFWPILIKLRLN